MMRSRTAHGQKAGQNCSLSIDLPEKRSDRVCYNFLEIHFTWKAFPNLFAHMKEIQITKYDYIDALRGFAILAVVFYHSKQWVIPTSALLSGIAEQGARGVQFFYIASALTLFLSLGTRKKVEEKPILSFFIRRFFRIAPLFYVAMGVYLIYDGLGPRFFAPNGIQWWFIPLTAVFMNGWLPETINSVVPGGWSIAVEMIFYLTVPFLFSRLKDIRSTLWFLFISLIAAKISTVLIVNFYSPYFAEDQQYLVSYFSNFWFFAQIPIFTLGILLYHILSYFPAPNKDIATPLILLSAFLFTAFIKVEVFANLLSQQFLFGAAFFLFALSLHFHPHKLLVNKLTTWIGKLSFSIYLVHFLVLKVVGGFVADRYTLQGNSGFFVAFLLVTSVSVAVSFITYKMIELPGIELGKKIIKNISSL